MPSVGWRGSWAGEQVAEGSEGGAGHEDGRKGVPQAEAEEGLGQVPAAGMSPLMLGWGHSSDWRP